MELYIRPTKNPGRFAGMAQALQRCLYLVETVGRSEELRVEVSVRDATEIPSHPHVILVECGLGEKLDRLFSLWVTPRPGHGWQVFEPEPGMSNFDLCSDFPMESIAESLNPIAHVIMRMVGENFGFECVALEPPPKLAVEDPWDDPEDIRGARFYRQVCAGSDLEDK